MKLLNSINKQKPRETENFNCEGTVVTTMTTTTAMVADTATGDGGGGVSRGKKGFFFSIFLKTCFGYVDDIKVLRVMEEPMKTSQT